MIAFNSFNSLSLKLISVGLLLINTKFTASEWLVGSLPTVSFAASSWHPDPRCHPVGAQPPPNGVMGWCAENNNPNIEDFLQIDLGKEVTISKIATWGRYGAEFDQYVSQYALSYSQDTITWISGGIFDGNSDTETAVTHSLKEALTGRYFRFTPKAFNIWKSMRVDLYELTVPLPVCDLEDTYPRSFEPVTCSADKENHEGLCYDSCKANYFSATGFLCIENCESGYTQVLSTCSKASICNECVPVCHPSVSCHEVCIPFVGCTDVCVPDGGSDCTDVCAPVPCIDVKIADTYTRTPSWPDQCPTSYDALSLGSIDALCYKSCDYGYIDAGVACICNIEDYYSEITTFTNLIATDFTDKLLDLIKALQPITDIDNIDSIFANPAEKALEPMTEFISSLNQFISTSTGNSRRLNNILRRLLNDKSHVFTIEIVRAGSAGISASESVGFAFDGDEVFSFDAKCVGVKTDVEVSTGITVSWFESRAAISGESIVASLGVDIADVVGIGSSMITNAENPLETLGASFGVALGVGVMPVELDALYCSTSALQSL